MEINGKAFACMATNYKLKNDFINFKRRCHYEYYYIIIFILVPCIYGKEKNSLKIMRINHKDCKIVNCHILLLPQQKFPFLINNNDFMPWMC